MDDILKELGWGDGFRIPVANEENRALEMEIQKKQKEKENLKSSLEHVTERVRTMKKHLENVSLQLDHNQNLIFAQTNQKVAEENLAKLAKTEDQSLTNELKKIKKEEGDIQDRLAGIQMDIDRALQHINRLNTTIKWDKDALLAWDEEVSRGDEDTQMLEKFRKEDEAKFRELELKRQNLRAEIEKKKNRLICLKNDVNALEQSLDKTAQMFRRHHVDRRTLVQQWEGSVRVLHQRDADINRVLEEIGNLKSLAKQRIKDLEEQKMFFENEQRNNEELEKDIENYNKEISVTKEKIRMMEVVLVEENDQLSTLKTVLGTTTTDLHKEIIKSKNYVKSIEAKQAQITEMEERKNKAKKDCELLKAKGITAADRIKHLELLLKEEEKAAEKNLLEFKKLDELMFQVSQQIRELKDGEKTQLTTIHQVNSCICSVKKDLVKSKTELNKQKELLYNMDFAYMEKDILFNKMLKPPRDEDTVVIKAKISELEEIQRNLLATNNLLTGEVARLEEDMRRVTVDIEEQTKEENYLKNIRQENLMLVECGQKQLKFLRIQNQDKQVDENVLKLRVKQAEMAIDKVGGKVFCLEKRRLQLEAAMKERQIEIKTLRDVLNVRKRVLNEQASNLNSRISLAKVRVENLKNKHDVEMMKCGKDENGEPLSLSQIKLIGAQEKFELQELGDKLDSQIKKTEKEIEAMENTLKVVNAANKAFRNNVQNIDVNSPEQQEKARLESNQAQLMAEYRKKKAILESLDVITLDLEEEYQQKLQMEEDIIKTWNEKDQQAAEADKDLKEQEEKLERAEKQLKKLIKEIRGTKTQKFQTVEEKDIELRELMDQNEYGLQQLAELVAKTYDTGPVVIQYLSEKGLSLPKIVSPSPSLKCPSTNSLPSARSTVSSKSSKSTDSMKSSKSSTCVYAASVVTLDSSHLSDSSESSERTKMWKPCGAVPKKKTNSDSKKK